MLPSEWDDGMGTSTEVYALPRVLEKAVHEEEGKGMSGLASPDSRANAESGLFVLLLPLPGLETLSVPL
jgi:hypothetical protein